MSLRGHPPPSGMRRHGSPTASASTIHRSLDCQLLPELVEKKLVEEIRRLARENNQLAEAQGILRRDVISAKDEVQKVQALIRSIETESNIQVRVAFEKAAKMELECREVPRVKMELEKSHQEAQELMGLMQEMTSELERASKELEIARTDIKKLPEMITELKDLREEHHTLCRVFEHEKRTNMDKVEYLQAMEKDLINMARQVERLQADVFRAESALHTPYGDLQPNSHQSHLPHAIYGNGPPYHIASTGTYEQRGVVQINGMVAHPHENPVDSSPPLPPPICPSPPPPPPPPPLLDPPPASDEGSGGDENTSGKGDNIGTDWREVGYESSESRVNEG